MVDFVLAGGLVVSFAAGIRAELHPGPGGTRGPVFVGAFGTGLLIAGSFLPARLTGCRPR